MKTKKLTWKRIIIALEHRGMLDWMPDQAFLKLMFRAKMGKKLNLRNPQTYSEKLQWLKLNDRKEEYTRMVDKALVKDYVAAVIGEQYIIPTLGVWDRFEDIDFSLLPDRFVLKCTHDSGGLVICKDKKKLDLEKAKNKINRSLKRNFYYHGREWPYKNVKPRILAEEYIEASDHHGLKDYKLFCFDGRPVYMFIASDRDSELEETKFDFYDMNFQHLDFTNGHPNVSDRLECPKGFEEMKRLAAKLSEGLPQLRVDFYDVNGKIYFGELTFFHWSGMTPFEPESWDLEFGKLLHLPEINK